MANTVEFERAVDQVIEDSDRLHRVVNGLATESVVTEDGSLIPSVRKAFADNLFFKTPVLPWVSGSQATVFNQLYAFNSAGGTQWWYAPSSTVSAPVTLPADPSTSPAWRMYNDATSIADKYAPIDSPILTGNPQAPTPAANSNSNTIATTSFVASAIATAISGIVGGNGTFVNLTASGLTTLNNLIVNGTTTLNGQLNADDVTGRFANLILTKSSSSISFLYSDGSNPGFKKSRIDPYSIQTHTLNTDIVVNGTASADNTTMSLTGNGNNVFDYVYIRGNSSKPSSEPRLKVTGVTEVENLTITGTVTGLSFSVDGQDISPRSVTTSNGVSVGGGLDVSGATTLSNTTVSSLQVNTTLQVTGSTTLASLGATNGSFSGTLSVSGLSTLSGGFTTGTGNGIVGGTLTIGGKSTVNNQLEVSGLSTFGDNITVVGDANLNTNGSGTTTVHNLAITGTVSGLTVDLTGQVISVAGVNSTGPISADGGINASGSSTVDSLKAGLITLDMSEEDTPAASWAPDGTKNVYNLTIKQVTTIGAWPDVSLNGVAFSAMIYLTQDSTGGHAVSLDSSYAILNTETINTDANSVTIIQLTYCGIGSIVDAVIVRRP